MEFPSVGSLDRQQHPNIVRASVFGHATQVSLSRYLQRVILGLIDLTITVYAIALVVSSLSTGVQFAGLSVTNAAKPLLVLALVIPIRVVLPGRPWFIRVADGTVTRFCNLARTRVRNAPGIVDVTFALLVTQPLALSAAFLANLLFVPVRDRSVTLPFERQRFVEIFAAWDSGWYFDIANRGYYYRPDAESSVAFFPLYPGLMRLVAWPFGSTERAIWSAGIVISCGAFALALLALHDLTRRLVADRAVARRTVLYVAVFPFALFFTRVYAESLFLLTSVLAIGRAYEGRWASAGLWGAAATLSRPNGVLVWIPLAVLAFQQPPFALRMIAARLMWSMLIPAALAGYCVFVYTLSGDPLAWLSAQSHWAYSLGHPPWQQLLKMMDRLVEHGWYGYFFASPMAPFRLIHGTVALVFLSLTPMVYRRLGPALGSYVLISLLVPLSSDALEGIGRYASVLFPVFIVVASCRSARLKEAILIGCALLLSLLSALFVTLHPMY